MEIEPYNFFRVIVPSDTVDMPIIQGERVKALYVGGTGNLVLVNGDEETALMSAIPAGTIVPFSPKRINSTSTTATLILGCWRF